MVSCAEAGPAEKAIAASAKPTICVLCDICPPTLPAAGLHVRLPEISATTVGDYTSFGFASYCGCCAHGRGLSPAWRVDYENRRSQPRHLAARGVGSGGASRT